MDPITSTPSLTVNHRTRVDFRYLLSLDQSNKLVQKFNLQNYGAFETFFFDTPDHFMHKKGSTLRLRADTNNEKYELSYVTKNGDEFGNHWHLSLVEQEFAKLQKNFMLPADPNAFSVLKDVIQSSPIIFKGRIKTERVIDMEWSQNAILKIDHNFFSNAPAREDYEVKICAKPHKYEGAKQDFLSLLARLSIVPDKQALNKYQRCLQLPAAI